MLAEAEESLQTLGDGGSSNAFSSQQAQQQLACCVADRQGRLTVVLCLYSGSLGPGSCQQRAGLPRPLCTATAAATPLLPLPCLALLLLAGAGPPCRRLGMPTGAAAPQLWCHALLLEEPPGQEQPGGWPRCRCLCMLLAPQSGALVWYRALALLRPPGLSCCAGQGAGARWARELHGHDLVCSLQAHAGAGCWGAGRALN